MKAVRLTKKDTGQLIWINVDQIAAIEEGFKGGSFVFGIGMPPFGVKESPSDIFDAMGQHR